jgi:hypothetical protein
MRRDYKREQEDLFQTLQDLQDAQEQREQRQRQERLQRLAVGLQASLKSLALFERQGFRHRRNARANIEDLERHSTRGLEHPRGTATNQSSLSKFIGFPSWFSLPSDYQCSGRR